MKAGRKAKLIKKDNFGTIKKPCSSLCHQLSHVFFSNFGQPLGAYFLKAMAGITFERSPMDTQPAFTCSKLTKETLEQGVKYGLNIFHTLL